MANEKKVLFEKSTTITDQHGTVRNKKEQVVYRVPTTPEFYMLFAEHVAFMKKLSSISIRVLALILESYVTRKLTVFISIDSKKHMGKELGVKHDTIQRAINNLIAKQVILTNTTDGIKKYILNPLYFGKGKWNDVHKLRQDISTVWNFKENTMEATKSVQTLYLDSEKDKRQKILEDKKTVSADKKESKHEITVMSTEQQAIDQAEKYVDTEIDEGDLFSDELEDNESEETRLKIELVKEEKELLLAKIEAKKLGIL